MHAICDTKNMYCLIIMQGAIIKNKFSRLKIIILFVSIFHYYET